MARAMVETVSLIYAEVVDVIQSDADSVWVHKSKTKISKSTITLRIPVLCALKYITSKMYGLAPAAPSVDKLANPRSRR